VLREVALSILGVGMDWYDFLPRPQPTFIESSLVQLPFSLIPSSYML
jgi:hypothetical protein